jgi:hypothetical protein
VKKDTEYELFFLRKEDGSRFFNPRLIRNIKLVCDFGDYFGSEKSEDPFKELECWNDRYIQSCASTILRSVGPLLKDFYHDAAKMRDHDLISSLKMALMALMMSANTANLSERNPIKSCSAYFFDFQQFIRTAINTRDYERLVAYPPKPENRTGQLLLEIIRRISHLFFAELKNLQEQIPALNALLRLTDHFPGVAVDSSQLKHSWSQLQHDYEAIAKMMKLHPNGPLIKVLDCLQEAGLREFDVLTQNNIPNYWFSLPLGERNVTHLRLPCPTRQEFINKAVVVEEFKEFLREHAAHNKRHLIFNVQDRTSWKEHARSVALEELQSCAEFKEKLTVVTLAIDTDFYYQEAPYSNENHAVVFIKQFKEQLEESAGGCYFPAELHAQLFPDLIDKLLEEVHQLFFHGRNVMTREARLDFIQLFYLLLELKIIELVKADSFSFCCKDGIDMSGSLSALIYFFIAMLNEQKLSESDYGLITLMIHGPALLIRERLMLPDRFKRMLSAMRTIEQTTGLSKAFEGELHSYIHPKSKAA